MINEKKLEADIENWLTEVGHNIGGASSNYFQVLFKGIKETLSITYMGKKERMNLGVRFIVHGVIVALLIIRAEEITIFYSDFLSSHVKSFLSKLLYLPQLTKGIAVLIGLNFFYGLGVKKIREEEEMHDCFEEIKFFTGKKRTIRRGDEKITISETPRLIRKIVKDAHTRIYIFQSKGILPAEWEKKKDQLEYILDGKIINFKRGKGKSMKLVLVTDEKFEELNEAYKKMELFDEQFEKMGLVGKGSREVEVFGEIKKTKNYPQFIEEKSEIINNKVVLTTTFKSSGLTLDDFKAKKYGYENVMNRLVVEINQDKLNKQIYHFKTIDTKDELKELYEWSNDIIDDRDGVLVLGEGRLNKVTLDLNETPHVLTGGVTGSGKSVLSNCLVYQGIKKGWYPILIDFKGGLELGMFEKFSNTGVLSEPKKVYEVLDKLFKEHEARLEEFKKYPGVKNIVQYNKRVSEELRLARIIVTIDELAEMLDVTGKNKKEVIDIQGIEGKLNSIARLSRSTGINILAGTQRPDSNVLKGQIKNNLGARICGRMTDKEPSIMVLGSPDATKIPEDVKGRYMFSVGSDPVIMQGYYFKESNIVKGNYLKGRLLTISTATQSSSDEQQENFSKKKVEPYEDFYENPKDDPEYATKIKAVDNVLRKANEEIVDQSSEDDVLLEDVIDFVMTQDHISISMLQRKYRNGYQKMARLMDAMEDQGVVGPSNGSKPREVLVKHANDDESSDEPKVYSSDENYKNAIQEIVSIIETCNTVTLRALKVTGIDHETLLGLLVEVYEEKELSETKQEQLKLLLFKEKKISNEEYSAGRKNNAEPII